MLCVGYFCILIDGLVAIAETAYSLDSDEVAPLYSCRGTQFWP